MIRISGVPVRAAVMHPEPSGCIQVANVCRCSRTRHFPPLQPGLRGRCLREWKALHRMRMRVSDVYWHIKPSRAKPSSLVGDWTEVGRGPVLVRYTCCGSISPYREAHSPRLSLCWEDTKGVGNFYSANSTTPAKRLEPVTIPQRQTGLIADGTSCDGEGQLAFHTMRLRVRVTRHHNRVHNEVHDGM